MKNALKLIVARSPQAGEEALSCLKAILANSPMIQVRYENVVALAFRDPQAAFTPDERATIASHLLSTDNDAIQPRSIRLSDDDWARAQEIGGGSATAGIRAALRAYPA